MAEAENMAEAEQGDLFMDNGESTGQSSPSESEPEKSAAMKDLQGSVSDVSMEHVEDTNGSPVKRGRGRPKGSGLKLKSKGDGLPKKRGRPKGSTVKSPRDLNGGTSKRGRPKGSVKVNLNSSGAESEDSLSPPRKRGRPKGTPKKLIRYTSANGDAVHNTPKRGRPKKGEVKGKRGRPKKVVQEEAIRKAPVAYGSGTPRKSRGRPKGSVNKPGFTVRLESSSGRPKRVHVAPQKLMIALPRKFPGKRGRPKKIGRGRPRKNPLSEEDELYQPRVWKALGRPRKYPKEDLPEGAETPHRGRGRPRKSESKKGAYLKKLYNKPAKVGMDGPPRKRGRPKKITKNSDGNTEATNEDANGGRSDEALEEEEEVSAGTKEITADF